MRIGLGYIKGLAEEEARGARRASASEAAPTATWPTSPRAPGVGRDGLERLAWAGACAPLGVPGGPAPRRDELWRLGVARGGERMRGRPHAQLALPLPLPAPPDLRALDSWERIVADYSSTGISLGEHPVEVLRPRARPRA